MKETVTDQSTMMVDLILGLLKDVHQHNQLPSIAYDRDVRTIKRRAHNESMCFFTKTLPLLGKQLDLALKGNQFNTPTNFKKKSGTKLPCLLNGLFKLIFSDDGNLLEEPCVNAIKDLRQLTFVFYKYQLPYDEALVDTVLSEFVADDKDICPSIQTVEEMSTIYYAKKVINEIFKSFSIDDLRPKNGPGSVANGIPPWKRYKPTKYYPSLDNVCHYSNMFFYNDRDLFDNFDRYRDLEWEPHGICKVLAVPKDSRGPRIISAEQSEFMTYQQALKNVLVPYLEKHPITGGQINFTDQSINGDLALEASRDGNLATLDLQKASNFNSKYLVSDYFEDTCIAEFLAHTRSEYAEMPDGEVVRLRMFAPMGSALCFPIQALVFFATLVGSRLAEGESLVKAAKQTYVYGDDIIVPTEKVQSSIQALKNVGLRVNEDKSCYTGKFRESCGVDAYNGINITPIKIKKTWCNKPDASTLSSWVAVANNFYWNGYFRVASYLKHNIEKAIRTKLPFVSRDSKVLGWETPSRLYSRMSWTKNMTWNSDLQCFGFYAITIAAKTLQKLHSGWDKMLRIAWYKPESPVLSPFDDEPFCSGAFSLRYRALKHSTWVSESEV